MEQNEQQFPGSSSPPTAVESEKDLGHAGTNSHPRNMGSWKWVAILCAILSSTFLFALDNTIVATIQPQIVIDFGEVNKLTWVSVGLVMTATATVLFWGQVYGQFSTKWTYALTVLLFEVGSAICGAAPNMNALIVGRVVCGLGGSGLYIGVLSLLAALTTIKERPMYVASTGLTWGLGMVLGPVIGGAFTESSAGWRWAFYINLCVGAVCAPVYIFIIPSVDPRPGKMLTARASQLDHVGAILNLGAFLTGVMAVSFGGVEWAWGSGRIIGLFTASGVLFILFAIQQKLALFTTKEQQLFPISFLRSRTMLVLFAQTACSATAVFVPVFFIPILFQFTRGDDSLQSGIRLLPFIVPCIFAVIVNGSVMSAYGLYMPWYLMGGILVTIGGATMFTIDSSTNVANIYGYNVLAGLGAGLFLQSSFSVAQAKVPVDMTSMAVGFITLAQVGGTTLALAIANTVFLNEAQGKISAILPDLSLPAVQSVITGDGGQVFSTLTETQAGQVIDALIDAVNDAYALVISAGALAIALSLVMKRERLFLQPAAGG